MKSPKVIVEERSHLVETLRRRRRKDPKKKIKNFQVGTKEKHSLKKIGSTKPYQDTDRKNIKEKRTVIRHTPDNSM